jgi:hypothetical protein
MNQEATASNLPAIVVQRLTGDETFRVANLQLQADVQGFWRWACSDLLGNTLRGQLAEYIVGLVLGCLEGARQEWDAVDLKWTPSGASEPIPIEVKSAAYLQSWKQNGLSSISFDIAPKRSWDPKTNVIANEPQRSADVYVFCLLHYKDKSTVDPLDLSQWSFFAVSSKRIHHEFQTQQQISLSRLEKVHGPPFSFQELKGRILDATKWQSPS